MMPGERAVLERLARELEIMNRREEIRRVASERPAWKSPENALHLGTLRFELDLLIESRPKIR